MASNKQLNFLYLDTVQFALLKMKLADFPCSRSLTKNDVLLFFSVELLSNEAIPCMYQLTNWHTRVHFC